jgi:hypothetical protein
VDARIVAQRLALLGAVVALAYTALLTFVVGFSAVDTYASWLVRKLFPGAYLLTATLAGLAVGAWLLSAEERPHKARAWDAPADPDDPGYWSR